MSHQAVTWAMEHAPMLLTPKGRPDTTARHVLAVLAEYAHTDGTDAYPSQVKIQYRTGYDRSTVRKALRRLEAGDLIVPVGTLDDGRTNYTLRLALKRPATDLEELKAEVQRDREAAADRQRRSRARRVTQSATVTVTDSASACHASEVRDVTNSGPERHGLCAPQTVSDPPSQPPVIPGDGRQASTGSGGSGAGGSAARRDESEQVSHSAIGAVIRDLPRRLMDLLPDDQPIPAAIEGAIRTELARGILPTQLVTRAKRRYLEFGIERDIESAEGEGVRTPIGALISLLRAGRCTSPRCDDGTDLDTGEECRTCEREAEDRRQAPQEPVQGAFPVAVPSRPAPAPVPAPRGRMVAQDCADRLCPNSFPAPAEAQAGLCPDCRENETEKASNA